MDCDKDGLLSSSDIVGAFAAVGKAVSDGEAQGMLSEAPGPVNFTQMVMLFAEKMAGGKFLKISVIFSHVDVWRGFWIPFVILRLKTNIFASRCWWWRHHPQSLRCFRSQRQNRRRYVRISSFRFFPNFFLWQFSHKIWRFRFYNILSNLIAKVPHKMPNWLTKW